MDIYATLGPACADEQTLISMFRAGLTGIRLNLSHAGLAESKEALDCCRSAARRAEKEFSLLIDMQGPELRIGSLSEPLHLIQGGTLTLGEGGVPVPSTVLSALEEGTELLLDDGKILLRVQSVKGSAAETAVLRGGVLKSRKSIAVIGASIHPPAVTDFDRENLACAAKMGVTAVMQPFVRDETDLAAVREVLRASKAEQLRLYAKIENQEGLDRLEKLLPAADAIVIARGDLGNAVGLPSLIGVQKDIASACRKTNTPFIVATELLSSMERNPVPTRAELSDIFNAVLDGAAGLMLTGETAVGAYPDRAVDCLKKVSAAAESWRAQKNRSGPDAK